MPSEIKSPKKLIEVALPLDAINVASSREKSIRQGHPSTLHLWWARRPLAAARAILFAQLVNDPGGERGYFSGKTKAEANVEREALFEIIRDLVKWENTNNEEVLQRARQAIMNSWRETCSLNSGVLGFDPENLPIFHDPFAGGGAIPLEAQRLGFQSFASDLNPVAVMINKAMIEIPPRFANNDPIGPLSGENKQKGLMDDWSGSSGLAEDVRRYGQWFGDLVKEELRPYYPTIDVPSFGKSIVFGWIWARTIKCPNPACNCSIPMLKSLQLSKKKGKQAFLIPTIVEKEGGLTTKFDVSVTPGICTDGNVHRRHATCFNCDANIPLSTLEKRNRDYEFGEQLVAIVAKTKKGKVFLPATDDQAKTAQSIQRIDGPRCEIDHWRSCTNCVVYGFENFEQLFTNRQYFALTTYADRISLLHEKVLSDSGDAEYAAAICLYMAFAIDRVADLCSSFATWINDLEAIAHVFTKQAIPMVWDFVECNPIDDKWPGQVDWVARVIERSLDNAIGGTAFQADAAIDFDEIEKSVISTDPPYYDNIPYSNLSDFFYMWMRRSLRVIAPESTATIATPKSNEIVANQFRQGSKEKAEKFFEQQMKLALRGMRERSNDAFPLTIYYAFKQSKTSSEGTSSTGWETFLSAILDSGLSVTGTWPVRTERSNRSMSIGNNALASSIVLVCRKRRASADTISRRQFQRELREQLPESLEAMVSGKDGVSAIAPVDLAQAAIGPGIAIFSKFTAVLNQDGAKMTIHDALVLINRAITEYLNPESGSFDADTLFCDSWFAEFGWATGDFGQANVLAQGKGTTVDGVRDAGVIESGHGKVRLLKWLEYPAAWDPKQDNRTPVWEALHHLIRALNQEGESGAGKLLAGMPERSESIRQLTYHLYTLCERKKWADDARAYNELIASWHAIVAASHDMGHTGTQVQLDLDT